MSGTIAARWNELEPLLDRLLDLAPAARDEFLHREVADSELRALLVDLLARETPGGFLDGSSADYAEALIAAPAATQPLTLGPYRLLGLIGEGGSGSVYRGEREADGYTQTVALKLLRVGLRDPQEQARFRRERRILARLEHPAIARLLDAGFTAEGVPWFALEYIEGDNITRWCDARRLDIDTRLRLFLCVCEAVDAAHRALIVHRDIKPANILVDAQGRPKLLDFGIAKLLDESERDDDTRTGLRRLTPAYAAPEQFSGGVVTTATDVYALGVLLHELLSGLRPRTSTTTTQRLPSQALSQDATRDTLAGARSTPLRALTRRLRGDLDTIVDTALAPEPARRYASVATLAADITAHLERRPIGARGSSTGYLLKKFLLRHRGVAAAALLLLASGAAGVWATLDQAQRARIAAANARAEAARAAAVKDFVLALFEGVTPDESKGREVGARELIERGEKRLAETLATHPELQAELATALAAAYRQLGALDRAAALAEQAVAANATGTIAASALIERARVHLASARHADAETDLRRVLQQSDAAPQHGEARVRLAEVLLERGHPDAARDVLAAALADTAAISDPVTRLRNLAALGSLKFRAGDITAAEQNLRNALALARSIHTERHTETARIEHDLAVALLQRGATAEAEELLHKAETTRRELLGGQHPDLAQTVFNLAIARQRQGDLGAAATLYAEALTQQRAVLGPHHPDVANSLNSLALLAWGQGDSAAAITRLREALLVARTAYGEQHPTVATMLGNLAGFERFAGQLDAALRDQNEGLAIVAAALGEQHYLVGVAKIGLAGTLAERGDGDAAKASFDAGLALLSASLGGDHADTLQSRAAFADLLFSLGDVAAARREIDVSLTALGASLPAGHPRRARIELVALRIRIGEQGCGDTIAPLQAAADSLAKGGMALLPDHASAKLLLARCLRTHGDRSAAATLAAADADLARLPYIPRRLRAERAGLHP